MAASEEKKKCSEGAGDEQCYLLWGKVKLLFRVVALEQLPLAS